MTLPTLFRPCRRLFTALVLTSAVAATALLPSCQRVRGTNVLLVTIDTLRDDHCSVSGYARRTTPVLEALAREGTRFETAYAPTATTAPTHASILTSLYPIAHRVIKNGMRLEESYLTLAEILSDRGYRTAAVVSSFVLDARFGLDQGFDLYDDDMAPADATIRWKEFEGHEVTGAFDQRADAATRKAVRELERLGAHGDPFFLLVHYFDPHAPFTPPPKWADCFPSPEGGTEGLAATIDAYDAEIAFADDEIGTLLRALAQNGLDQDTLVVVTADHGEGLMDHGHMNHGVHIYEEAVRVPLVLRLPGRIEPGRRVGEPVELVDLVPTILDLVGVDKGEDFQGRSLAAALEGREDLDPERPVHLHRRHYKPGRIGDIPVAGEKFGVRVGTWKYIEGKEEGTRELFDLVADPGERNNVVDEFGDVADQLSERIDLWMKAFGRDTGLQSLSPEDVERLKALGYVE